MNATTTTTTIAPAAAAAETGLIDPIVFLSKKQVAIGKALNSLNIEGLQLVASNGKGVAAKAANAVIAAKDFEAALCSFMKSKCTNVRPFTVVINSHTGQFLDSDALPSCPTKLAEFWEYPASIALWVESSKTLRTRENREKAQNIINAIIDSVKRRFDANQ